MYIFLILFSYLTGSIPFGILISRAENINLYQIGSNNTGATNVYRALGIKYAIVVGFLDVLKGAIPVYISMMFFPEWITALTAFAALTGHIYPLYTGFKGGKGVATFAGTLAVIFGLQIFFLLFLLWIFFLLTFKIMSKTNLLLGALTPVIAYLYLHSLFFTFYMLAAAVFIGYTHRENIKRIIKGTEKKIIFSPRKV